VPDVRRQDGGSLLLNNKMKDSRSFYENVKDKWKIEKGLDKTLYGALNSQ
jgi:hypothetical protein